MKNLVLHVRACYFAAMLNGTKPEEFRKANDYWRKRLEGRDYGSIFIYCGYPKKGDSSKLLIIPYAGYTVRTITHEHFGADPVEVFAIRVNLK